MLLATTNPTPENPKQFLIIGLEAENIKRLQDDMPIFKDLEVEGIEDLKEWKLVILGPEDTVRFVSEHG